MSSKGPQEGRRRKRTKFNKNQHKVLIEAFENDPYPDITVREELAKRIQIPEPRIQVWFQNRRARIPKNTQKSSSGETKALVPRSHQGRFCVPDCSSHGGLLPRSDSSVTLQSYAGRFWELEGTSGQTILSRHASVLGMNVASPDLETPVRGLGEPSGDFHRSPSSGFSPEALGLLLASQQSSQLEAGSTGTLLGDPRPPLTYGGWALQGWGPQPPSDEQQPCGGWQPPPDLEPGMVPQQPLSQHPRAWEQPAPPPPPSPQEHWPNPADPSPLWLHIKPAEVPAGHQEQFPLLPPGQEDLGGRPRGTLAPTHCSFRSST